MRFVFIGSGSLAVLTGRMLAERGHEVILIEQDLAIIDALREELDVGFLHGDGTRPAILREAGPEATDLLFCVTRDDQANIIASLVARSLGYARVVTKIEDP
jgi:trk system potassium uptake protein TrkA